MRTCHIFFNEHGRIVALCISVARWQVLFHAGELVPPSVVAHPRALEALRLAARIGHLRLLEALHGIAILTSSKAAAAIQRKRLDDEAAVAAAAKGKCADSCVWTRFHRKSLSCYSCRKFHRAESGTFDSQCTPSCRIDRAQ